MRYLIIGLGIYGTNLAIDLTDMGHEVIGVDVNPSPVEAIKDRISTVYVIDTTEEAALSVLPLKAVDLVIVTIGENFGASIKTVAMLRKAGVKTIYARAVDDVHRTILEGFKVDRILIPEQRAARELTRELALGAKIDAMAIDNKTYVLKFTVPDFLVGSTLSDIDLTRRYGIKLVALSRTTTQRNMLGLSSNVMSVINNPEPSEMLQSGDELTIMCTTRQFRDLMRHVG